MDGGSGRRPSWEREEQFRSLLHRAAKKASREMMDTIADIAIRDDKVAYKAVCALLLHEMKQLKPAYRLKLFFVASAILRQSKSRRGERDKYAPRFAPLLDTMADLLAPLPADQLGSVLKVLEVWWRDEIFPPATVAALQKRFGSLLEAAQQGGGGASSSGGGGAAAAPALGMAASVTGVPAAVAPPPPPQLSSMSPGSLSGQAGAAAAGSSQGQGPAAAAAPAQASQISKAAGGGTPVLPAAADSLSSRPPVAATANLPLHTVGSSSQLLRQQSTEAYDPFAPAMEQADPLPAAALPPFPGQSAAAPALPFPPQEAGQTLAGAWQQPQPHPKQLQGAGHGAWQYSQQQSPAVGAWQPPAPSPPKQQAAAAATWQQQQQLPASVPWQAHNMHQVGGSAWHAPSPTAPAGPLSSSHQDAGHSPAPPPPPPPPAQQESTGALRPQSSAQDAVHLMPAGQAAGGSHVPPLPHPQQEEVAPPPPPPAEHPASKGPLPADVPAAAGVESAAGRAELHARRKRKSRWSDD